jgi:hypothetical protein
MKKVPMRSCVVTKEKLPKNELVRVVKTDDGVIVDLTGKVNGHGVYLKKDLEVISTAKSKKILDRLLETTVPESVFEELINIVK